MLNAIEKLGELVGRAVGLISRAISFTVISAGIEAIMDIVGKRFAPKLKPLTDLMEESGKIPDELRPLFDEMKEPTGQIASMLAQSAGGAAVGGAVGRLLDALLLPMSYFVNSKTRNVIADLESTIAMRMRAEISPVEYESRLANMGIVEEDMDRLAAIHQPLLSVDVIRTLMLREIDVGINLDAELRKQGVTSDRIAAIKESWQVLPGVSDLIRMAVREVFTPDIREAFKLDQDLPEEFLLWAKRMGLSPEWAGNFWAAHWELPSITNSFAMLHRKITKDDGEVFALEDIRRLLRAHDVMPAFRDPLIQIAYDPITRVDVRRMWDMGVISEERLKSGYEDVGYDDDNSDLMVLWTKVYVAFPDLISRYKNGWIGLDTVRSELIEMGMPEERVETMLETKFKKVSAERTMKERDLTKAEIVKPVMLLYRAQRDRERIEDDMERARIDAEITLSRLYAPIQDQIDRIEARIAADIQSVEERRDADIRAVEIRLMEETRGVEARYENALLSLAARGGVDVQIINAARDRRIAARSAQLETDIRDVGLDLTPEQFAERFEQRAQTDIIRLREIAAIKAGAAATEAKRDLILALVAIEIEARESRLAEDIRRISEAPTPEERIAVLRDDHIADVLLLRRDAIGRVEIAAARAGIDVDRLEIDTQEALISLRNEATNLIELMTERAQVRFDDIIRDGDVDIASATAPFERERAEIEEDLLRVLGELSVGLDRIDARIVAIPITPEQATTRLMDMGYDRSEAEYVINVTAAAALGSPESNTEFRAMTARYRRSLGEDVKVPTPDIHRAERLVKTLKARLIEAELEIPEEAAIRVIRKRLQQAEANYYALLKGFESGDSV